MEILITPLPNSIRVIASIIVFTITFIKQLYNFIKKGKLNKLGIVSLFVIIPCIIGSVLIGLIYAILANIIFLFPITLIIGIIVIAINRHGIRKYGEDVWDEMTSNDDND